MSGQPLVSKRGQVQTGPQICVKFEFSPPSPYCSVIQVRILYDSRQLLGLFAVAGELKSLSGIITNLG